MTSNNAESMNALDVQARESPHLRLIEFLRGRMQQWFYQRRENAAGTFTVLAAAAEERIVEAYQNSIGFTVSR